jgi:(2Fe-2S) ferredoxin
MLLEMAKPNVTVSGSGCLANCGKGPNVEVLIPGNEGLVYNGISSVEDAAELLEERCGGVPASQAAEAYTMKLEGDALVSAGNLKAADEAYTRSLALDVSGHVLVCR